MILFRIIGVFWLSICSMFSYGSNESCESSICDYKELDVHDSSIHEKDAHSNDGYIYWGSMGDFYDNDFLTNYLNMIQDTYGSIANSMQIANINMQVGLWSNFTYDGTTPYLTTYQNVDSIWCTYVGNGASNDVVYYYYTMDFYNENTKIFWFQFLVFPAYEDNNGIHWFNTTYGTNPTNINYRIVDSDLFMQDNVYYFSVGGATNNYNLKLLLGIDPTESDYSKGYQDGYDVGYSVGYQTGLIDAGNTNPYMNSIFTGIFEVGLLPVNVFLTLFNYEVFGINISGFISGLLTISVIVIILRFLFGGGKSGK